MSKKFSEYTDISEIAGIDFTADLKQSDSFYLEEVVKPSLLANTHKFLRRLEIYNDLVVKKATEIFWERARPSLEKQKRKLEEELENRHILRLRSIANFEKCLGKTIVRRAEKILKFISDSKAAEISEKSLALERFEEDLGELDEPLKAIITEYLSRPFHSEFITSIHSSDSATVLEIESRDANYREKLQAYFSSDAPHCQVSVDESIASRDGKRRVFTEQCYQQRKEQFEIDFEKRVKSDEGFLESLRSIEVIAIDESLSRYFV